VCNGLVLIKVEAGCWNFSQCNLLASRGLK
jgi:hypothetical protein